MTPRRTLAERAAYHRAELERLTGKMVSLRDRTKYNAAQKALRKKARQRAPHTLTSQSTN